MCLFVCVLAVASAGWSGEKAAAKKKPASPGVARTDADKRQVFGAGHGPNVGGLAGQAAKTEAADEDEALVKELVKILDETKSFDTFCVTASILCRVCPKARSAVPGIIRNAERLKILDKHLLGDKETKKGKVANDFLEGLGKLLPAKTEAGGAAEESAAPQKMPASEPVADLPQPHGKGKAPDSKPHMPYADVPTPEADATPGPARGQSPATGDTQEILRRLSCIEQRLRRIESRLPPPPTPQLIPQPPQSFPQPPQTVPTRPPQAIPYQY
jgi:hypothetical protein